VNELLAHLEAQVASAERLHSTVLAQTEAIKTQNVPELLARLGDVQTELGVRKRLEVERDRLIAAAAARRSVAPETINLDAMLDGAPADFSARARALSAHLRSVLAKVARIHASNRLLIRQELTFVDHLLRVISGTPQAGYSPGGWASSPTHRPTTSVDARA
jgi:hypothetical protein